MKGWRTILFNVVGVGTVLLNQYAPIVPPKALPYIGLGIAVGNIALRSVTTTPMGQKSEVNTIEQSRNNREGL